MFTTSSAALRRVAASLLAPCLSALALGACGGADSEPASATDNDRDTARLKLEKCLRDNGVELPAGRGQGGGPVRVDRAEVEKAIEGPCKKLQQAAFGNVSEEQREEFEDAFQAFAQCMRDNGVDVPDITAGGGPQRGTTRIDRDDPDVREARERCEDKLPRGGPGLALGGGPPR